MTKLTTILSIGGLALAASALAVQASRQLVIDGKTVQSQIKQEDGHYWVALDDMAKYFGYAMTVTDSQVTLARQPVLNPSQQPNQAALNQAAQSSPGSAPVLGAMTSNSTTETTPTPNANNPAAAQLGTEPGAAQQFTTTTGTIVNRTDLTTAVKPNLIAVPLGQVASVSGLDFKVTDVHEVGPSYKDRYDQRGTTLHARYKTDTLAIAEIEETNRGQTPVQAFMPQIANVTLFDSQQMGFSSTALDIRQTDDVIQNGTSDVEGEMQVPYESNPAITLGPGGTMRFAAIASVPKDVSITGASLDVTNFGLVENPAGTIIMVNPTNH